MLEVEDRVATGQFNQWLRETRIQRGLSMRVLGIKTGVDYSTISRLERTGRRPKLSTAVRLTRGLTDYWERDHCAVSGIPREAIEIGVSVWVRQQRKAKHLSQREVGNASGVNHATISKAERGQRGLSLDTAVKLVMVFQKP